MSVYSFVNLKNPQNISSGVADYILIAPVYDFEDDGIKCPTAPFTNPGDEVKITEAHVFKADKAFAKIALAPEKNQFSAKVIGDKGFQKYEFEVDIFIAGSYAELHEAMKNYLNTPLIAMQKDSNCEADLWYQFGCDCVYAWMSPEFTSGTNKDGTKGYNGKITYTNGYVQLYDVAGGPVILGD